METAFVKYKKTINIKVKLVLLAMLLMGNQFVSFAQEKIPSAQPSSVFSNPLFIALLIIIILLLVIIIVFANVVKVAALHSVSKEKKSASINTITALIVFGLSVHTVSAQSTNLAVVDSGYWGLDSFTFYMMVTIIAFELFIAWMLYSIFMRLLGTAEYAEADANKKAEVKQPSLMEKINASVAIEKEADILLDHNYDGIQELDNNLPPWWKYGFYLTIVFAFVYIVHYHFSNTGKLQLAEYEEEVAQGKAAVEEYRKKAANLVDENNVTVLTDAASLDAGKTIYLDNCAACHGRAGEGGVGPNLTDAYWVHSGGIKDIFKSIKYGWPEKGMKSWQQDLGAIQIHEVSSYIKSLVGTNPPNAKAQQGELYTEEKIVTDSTKVVTVKDSTAVVSK